MKKLNEAIKFATKVHDWQYRWDWTPYILHPLRVLNKLINKYWVWDEDLLISAILHDVVEDTQATIEQIEELFWKPVAKTVALLTHEDDETYEIYIATLLKNKNACLIKLADIEDNSAIENSSKASYEKQSKYIKAYKLIKESLWK